ncbi:DUF6174 domain-containing protein [Pseudobacteriovorax antillogorgiicola]|uniref:Uncharacterized protein n=1 Tax=Pseudobacteriovorax antillogorgiicola TaxID=1513793 RepID=A0A1Y6BYK5_9BACT|nr:DUF6174 domain-containing protein [Pseudobacteriovorax antillogorgiicola]TCS52967.1 hypothetical protein EDD56_10818 [Pseudobacteriovorax antillogorgiicola]SMF27472.1 hypothetical protein SAMN06296036_108229 [Pseudobacteriovorax antillogorgiicola]
MKLLATLGLVFGLSLSAMGAESVDSKKAPELTSPGSAELWSSALARWKRANLANYSYSVDIFCFCGDVGGYDVTVKDYEVVDIQKTSEGRGGYFDGKMDSLFRSIELDIIYGAKFSAQEYDPKLGYPVKVYQDTAPQVDYFYHIDITNFEILD